MADVISFNHFGKITLEMHKAMSQVVRKTAFDVQAIFASTCARDTSFMANSAYVVTSQESTYGGAGSPPGDSYLLPEVAAPDNDLTAYTAVAANYTEYVELGTRFMPAQPAFYPAVDTANASFQEALGKIEDMIKGGL